MWSAGPQKYYRKKMKYAYFDRSDIILKINWHRHLKHAHFLNLYCVSHTHISIALDGTCLDLTRFFTTATLRYIIFHIVGLYEIVQSNTRIKLNSAPYLELSSIRVLNKHTYL